MSLPDVRFAVGASFVTAPRALAAVLTLRLGIGAVTALFNGCPSAPSRCGLPPARLRPSGEGAAAALRADLSAAGEPTPLRDVRT